MVATYSRVGNGLTNSRQSYIVIHRDEVDRDPSIGNLIFGADYAIHWSGGWDTTTAITTSFGTSKSLYDYRFEDGGALKASEFSQAQKGAAIGAMTCASQVCDLAFIVVADSPAGAGDIRWANTSNTQSVPTALGHYPGGRASASDIWFGGSAGQDTTPGTYGYYSYVHELGHALGLNHPHQSQVDAEPGEDQLKFSVMSYRDHAGDSPDDGVESAVLPTGFMLNDIAALQALYGANLAFRAGDDIYQWASDATVFETLWDAGGIDTLDASNQTQGVLLSLAEGSWSEIGNAFFNGAGYVRDCLGVAFGCTIENATGSAHADRLLGNAAANLLLGLDGADLLDGGAGNDTLNGGAGHDVLEGGAGIDVAQYSGARASHILSLGSGALAATMTRGTEDIDHLSGIERVQFSDYAVALDLEGNAGTVAKVLGITGGIANLAQVGAALDLVDAGMTAPQLVDHLTAVVLGDAHSHADFVQMVWRSLFGADASAQTQALWVSLIDGGMYTEASLGVAVADSAQNLARIDFAGLSQTGLNYLF